MFGKRERFDLNELDQKVEVKTKLKEQFVGGLVPGLKIEGAAGREFEGQTIEVTGSDCKELGIGGSVQFKVEGQEGAHTRTADQFAESFLDLRGLNSLDSEEIVSIESIADLKRFE